MDWWMSIFQIVMHQIFSRQYQACTEVMWRNYTTRSASEYPGNKKIKILLILLSLNQFIYKIDKPYYFLLVASNYSYVIFYESCMYIVLLYQSSCIITLHYFRACLILPRKDLVHNNLKNRHNFVASWRHFQSWNQQKGKGSLRK
jgi:hypothetical protein